MKTKLKYLLAAVLFGAVAFAATEPVDRWTGRNPVQFIKGTYTHPESIIVNTSNKVTRSLGGSATIDFTVQSVGRQESSGITVTGAQAGDPCAVGVPTAAGALAAEFTCYVSAANTVKVVFAPKSEQSGTSAALNGASPSVITVTNITASSVCTASAVGTTAGEAIDVSLSSTTLTLTGPNSSTSTVNYRCVAPVDPASGTFYVRVISSQ